MPALTLRLLPIVLAAVPLAGCVVNPPAPAEPRTVVIERQQPAAAPSTTYVQPAPGTVVVQPTSRY